MRNWVAYNVTKADGRRAGGRVPNLRVNTGVNWQATHMGSSAIDAIKNIAITENTASPAASDSSLAGELTADGLSRTTATFAHTANQSLYTLTASWQYTGASVVTVAKAGILYFSERTVATNSADTLFVETALSPVAVLDSNDTLTIAWGITI